jgi:hypothetical protein
VHERGWALVAGDTGVVVARSRLPLVGRRRELQFIRDRLELARAGRPQGVVITGPAGIGKSRLAREVRGRAREEGFQDVHVTTINGDGVAFGALAHHLVPLLIDAFGADEAYRSDVAVLEELVGARNRNGATVLDEPTAGEGMASTEGPLAVVDDAHIAQWIDQHRHDLVQRLLTLTRLTIEAAQRHPLVVVVDDLQLVDGATLIFVDQLLVTAERVARHEDVPLLVLCLARTADPGEPDIADQLARLPMCDALTLGGIDRLEALDLLAALGVDTHGPGAQALVRASGGSPLFLESVSRHLLAAGTESGVTTLAGVPLPETVFDAVASGLQELDDETRELLADVALLGDVVPVELLAFVTDRSEGELAELLEPAAAAGLIELRGPTVRFTHGLRRLAAASVRDEEDRQRRHFAVAHQLVERAPGVLPDLGALAVAHHLVEAGPRAPTDLLARYSERAATECLASGNWHEAARFYDVAAEAADVQDPPLPLGQMGAYHLGASRAWVGALDMERAIAHADRAARCFEAAPDPARWAEAVLLRYRCLVYQARYGISLPEGDDLRRLMEGDGSLTPASVDALVTASELAWIRGDAGVAADLADAAHEQAVDGGFDAQAAASLVSRATAAWLTLDLHGAERLLSEAHRLAVRADDAIGVAVSAGHAAFTQWLLGGVDEAEELARVALAASEDAGRQLERTMPLAVLTAIGVARGDRSIAELRADEALLLQRASGDWWTAPFVSGPLAYAAALAGDRVELVAQLRMLRDGLGGEPGRAVSRVIGLWARAMQGAPRPTDEAALTTLDDPLVRAEFPEPTVGLAALCAAYVDTADLLRVPPPAIVVERLDETVARGQVLASTLPMLLPRVMATVSRLTGDLDGAEARGRAAVDLAHHLGLEMEAARAHLELARVLGAKGSRDAVEQYDAFTDLAETHRLVGLLDLAGRLSDVPSAGTQMIGGELGLGGCPVAVVVDLATRSWRGDRIEGSAYQQVRRQVMQTAAQQVEAFGGRLGTGPADVLLAWFPSVRLAVEFAFRTVARSRRRGGSVGVGVELTTSAVPGAEAVAVAQALAQLAGADEVLVSARARDASERTHGIEFRHHSRGRVEGASQPLEIVRARLLRSDPGS